MKGLTEIRISINERADMAFSSHIFATLTVNGRTVHWPKSDAFGAGILVDETEVKERLKGFIQDVAEFVDQCP